MPGMKLAKRIFSEDGLVLLGKDVTLTEKLIRRLAECGINYVYIADQMTDDVKIPETFSDEVRIQAIGEIRAAFREMVDLPRKKGTTYPYVDKKFRRVMKLVLDELGSHRDAMIMVMNMGMVDNYLYQHSLNVCIYTTLLGMAHGYTQDQLYMLGLGALLHDIGKTQISSKVLLKPGALTKQEYEEMKRHAELGYALLKDEPNIPLIVAHCAYQHHERLDGSGYPRGIRGDDIHDYAKWIGLVDSYDAMTTTRVYRGPMLPHQAIETLFCGTGTLYEQHMVQTFRDRVAIYPIGLTVKLNTGETGIVIDVNGAYVHRPTVRVLYDEFDAPLKSPVDKDLSKHLTTMIVGIEGDDSPGPDTAMFGS